MYFAIALTSYPFTISKGHVENAIHTPGFVTLNISMIGSCGFGAYICPQMSDIHFMKKNICC